MGGESVGTDVLVVWVGAGIERFQFDRVISSKQVWQYFMDSPKYDAAAIRQMYETPEVTQVVLGKPTDTESHI